MIRMNHLLAACAALMLSACSSREPLDYLPDTGAYLTINAEKVRNSQGGTKVAEVLEQIQPGSPSVTNPQLQRLYVGIDGGPRSERAGYGVAIGSAGMPDQVLSQMKAAGAREQKMSGRTVVTSGALSMTPVGDTGLLLFQSQAELDKMIRTSKKKNAAATQSSAFTTLQQLADKHSAAVVADATPLLAFADMQLQQLAKFDPEGAAALREVRTVSLTMDWETQPVLAATLHVAGEETRENLAGLVNMGLSFASNFGGDQIPRQLQETVRQLKAITSPDGVSLNLQIPAEQAENFLRALENRVPGK